MHTLEENMSPGRQDEELRKIERLYKAVRDGNLNDTTVLILESQPGDEAWAKIITDKKETALHVAVANGHEDIVKVLVNQMSDESLKMIDSDGYTALIMAAVLGNKTMVECMLGKKPGLISIRLHDSDGENLPVVMAIDFGQIEMARYLYYLTPDKDLISQDNDQEIRDCNGATLFTHAIYTGTLGICTLSAPPISETRLNFSNREQCQSSQKDQNNRSVLSSATCCYLVSGVLNFFVVEGITQLYEMKRIHYQYNELLSQMCELISKSNTQQLKDGLVYTAICRAAKNGISEFVSKILEIDRRFLWTEDINKRNIFMLAVLHRQEKIFNILYGLDTTMNYSLTCLDVDGNNMLHMAGMIEDSTRINQIPGAALQMQRELQWFKEIERIVQPRHKETKNGDDLTPRQLFTKNHADMKEKGEKWMKNTAKSCTVVGTLIVTIMFAAVFTLPGDNNQSIGLPKSLNNFLFKIFIISDALSLFSSSTSVLMFLGILTSRYSEEDFLEYLPRQMIIGLLTLFCSIATMMITFSSALLIILHEQLRIAIPLICLASVPVTFFVWIQFPILKDMIISTYGPGIFDRKMKS